METPRRARARARARKVRRRAVAQVRQPHRYYHTATHIMKVVRNLSDLSAVPRAAAFARAARRGAVPRPIYDPRADDNEARTAALAIGDLHLLGWSVERCNMVQTLVLATAGHLDPGHTAAGRAGLPMQPTPTRSRSCSTPISQSSAPIRLTYQGYVTGVRAEYFFVDDEHWRVGRGRVLRHFLDSPRLFATEHLHAEVAEHRARANIEAELAALRPGGHSSDESPAAE